ncbi:D-alanine--D-alanine ligase [Wolbachia pipientis]|uniref:D-alanine--D-alanine ligase n=1 Tax=Wolbachia pipientis TaxID=955 RepID=A0A1E7QKA5_WOLPI|nr:D-alanine--D-alanine ligase [Wolbachia pipientis]OEY86659.1 D-alanine--D-alanine ligase [Wolbachia pipientis]
MSNTIAVLSGGFSLEREVSLNSGKVIKQALDELSYNAIEIDVNENIAQKLMEINPDLAFIALHGPYGEDGCIQGLLEILGIQYTHSGVMASSIAMNKVMSKHLFASLDIDTPIGYVVSKKQIMTKSGICMDYPYVLKPINEGSSIGVYIIFSDDDFQNISVRDQMIIEEYIPGIELHTAVLLDKAIGTIEVRTKNKFYDYEAKYTSGLSERIFPPEIPDDIYNMTLHNALKVHKFLGCRTISRSDFLYNPKNHTLKMLEINTHPGFTQLSMVPEIARLANGMGINELVKIIVEDSV